MSHKVFDNNLVAIRKNRIALTLSQPGYTGMWILDISKLLMCQFPYDYIKNKYGNNLRILFTDTNNFMFSIKTKDSYENCNCNKEIFDLTNYSTRSKYYDHSNKLAIIKMEDGSPNFGIKEFVRLKSKNIVIVSIRQ